ncbi:MAG: hypothetical protein FWC67_03695 [Defluviitaleaceae bacterium]|nr:hypothetical protein [Defluviitaleaceae bacterium]
MKKNNFVTFKGGKNGIIIMLDKNASYENIIDALKQKAKDSRKFFGDAQVSVTFKGRDTNDEQIAELLEILKSETELSVESIENLTGSRGEPPEPPPAELKTYFHYGSLRSGQTIDHRGCVVIWGDVNNDARISATGNISVFGALRGMVHAGRDGDETAMICANALLPHQILRIAGKHVNFPKEMLTGEKVPARAYIDNGAINIEKLGGLE